MFKKKPRKYDPRDNNAFYKRLDHPIHAAKLLESALSFAAIVAAAIILWLAFA